MTVSYNFRKVKVKKDDGSEEYYNTCDTDHWNFWGASGGKNKKNDHIFYNSCKKHVIEHYRNLLMTEFGKALREVVTWADNCPGQFGCVQTYRDIANADDEFGILMSQYFAEVYCFKSVVDSIGKVCQCH